MDNIDLMFWDDGKTKVESSKFKRDLKNKVITIKEEIELEFALRNIRLQRKLICKSDNEKIKLYKEEIKELRKMQVAVF